MDYNDVAHRGHSRLNHLQHPPEFRQLLHITYQPELKLLVCLDCGTAVRPSLVRGHLRAHHRVSLTPQTVANALGSSGLSFAGDEDEVYPPQDRISLIPWLKMPRDGFQCLFCAYCYAKISSLGKHIGREHPTNVMAERLRICAVMSASNGSTLRIRVRGGPVSTLP
jgi:hypothetical protein